MGVQQADHLDERWQRARGVEAKDRVGEHDALSIELVLVDQRPEPVFLPHVVDVAKHGERREPIAQAMVPVQTPLEHALALHQTKKERVASATHTVFCPL